MASNIKKIADLLGAKVVAQVPDAGRGAFGAYRLAEIVARLQARLEPGQGKRPGRPTAVDWVHHSKVPMSDQTALSRPNEVEAQQRKWRRVMSDDQKIYAYNCYLDQRAEPFGKVRDDLPYSANLDLIVAQVNLKFGAQFSHGEIYQAISHTARRGDLGERGMRRESDVPLGGPG